MIRLRLCDLGSVCVIVTLFVYDRLASDDDIFILLHDRHKFHSFA
jgi:hypothetical protein